MTVPVTKEDENRRVAVCGELMDATCALYNRLGKDLLCLHLRSSLKDLRN